MNAVLLSSLPRRQGLNSTSSSHQLAMQHRGTVHEELNDDLHSAENKPVLFDVGDDISYVMCDVNFAVISCSLKCSRPVNVQMKQL